MAKKMKQQSTLTSIDDATNVMRQLKEIELELHSIQTKANARILTIQEELAERVGPLAERRLGLETDLRLYAEQNRSALFVQRKTITTPFGVFGFRQMPPSVELVMRKAEDVVSAMRAAGKRWKDFLREKVSIDKPAIKSAYDDGRLTDADLQMVGLRITSSEEFGYAIDRQELGDA